MNKKLIVILGLIFITQTSCIFDSNDSDDEAFNYPLTIGNSWQYQRTLYSYIKPDSGFTDEYIDTALYESTMNAEVARKVELNNGIQAYQITGVVKENFGSFVVDYYYSNKTDGLYLYAHRNSAMHLPKKTQGKKYTFNGRHFSSLQELSAYVQQYSGVNFGLSKSSSDSLLYEEPPVKTLAYPMEIGTEWTYRKDNNPWRMDKRVTDLVNLELDCGTFDCYEIRYLYDLNDDGNWDNDIWILDFIGKKGLVKREIHLLNVATTTQNSEIIRRHDMIDTYWLIDYGMAK